VIGEPLVLGQGQEVAPQVEDVGMPVRLRLLADEALAKKLCMRIIYLQPGSAAGGGGGGGGGTGGGGGGYCTRSAGGWCPAECTSCGIVYWY
jgi:hypothetical protein